VHNFSYNLLWPGAQGDGFCHGGTASVGLNVYQKNPPGLRTLLPLIYPALQFFDTHPLEAQSL
jgi:hypothetical protein